MRSVAKGSFLASFLAPFVLASVGCTATESAGSKAASPAEADLPPPPQIAFTWKACTGNFQAMKSCGTAQVPLDWSDPEGKQIELFAARLGPGNASTQLFMVQGGPGGSADALVDVAQKLALRKPDLDIYLVEHRGVGHSSRLECTSAATPGNVLADEAPKCVSELVKKWGEDGLAQFTTTNAARDLASAVASLRTDGGQAFVYGVSYGTYWVHRMLQVAPKVADGAILDSAVPATGAGFDQFDEQGDPVLARIGDLCKAQSKCATNLGKDPTATMKKIIATFDSSTCATSLQTDRAWLRGQVFRMLMHPETSGLVPSFLYRMQRCSSADQKAVVSLVRTFAQATTAGIEPTAALPEGDLGSGALYNNVVFSELWTDPAPTQADLKSRLQTVTLSCGQVPKADGSMEDWVINMDRRRTVWPSYAKDDFVGNWAKTSVPVLVLNGDLDVQTPIESARAYETGLSGEGKTFVQVPYANHGTIIASPTRSIGATCGMRIILGFMDQPTSPDTSCTSETLPPDVSVDAATSQALYGTPSAWEGLAPSPATGAFATEVSATRARILDQLRQRIRLVPALATTGRAPTL